MRCSTRSLTLRPRDGAAGKQTRERGRTDTAEDKGTVFKKKKAKDIIEFISEKEEPDDGEL